MIKNALYAVVSVVPRDRQRCAYGKGATAETAAGVGEDTIDASTSTSASFGSASIVGWLTVVLTVVISTSSSSSAMLSTSA